MDPIKPGRNYVYCATFQLAWDDFRRLASGVPLLQGRPPVAAGLNGSSFPRSSLSPASYVARAGLVSEQIRDKIIAEMGEKFPGVSPSLSDAGAPNELIVYSFLQKNLPFEVRFDRVSEPLLFHGAGGDAKVASFGFEELASASSDTDKLRDQVDVLHYQSDDEFVLRLRPKTDEIVLAKIRPGVTLGDTLRGVQELIGTPPKKVDRPRLEEKEKLLIPRLAFNILRRYGELIDRHLENPGKEDWRIREAKQAVRFLLNEYGARLESEVVLSRLGRPRHVASTVAAELRPGPAFPALPEGTHRRAALSGDLGGKPGIDGAARLKVTKCLDSSRAEPAEPLPRRLG